jgi:hypothetical protein
VDKNLRASLVAAGAATALSALVGIIAGVGFLTLFIRAIVCGLFIGAAVYGAIFFLKMVPGILVQDQDIAGPKENIGDEDLTGANVNIVLPGDDAQTESIWSGEESQRDFADALPSGNRGSAPAPFYVKDGLGKAPGEDEVADLPVITEASLLEPEGLGGEANAAFPSSSSAMRGSSSSSGIDDLDVLPDLESYSDSFTASELALGGGSTPNSSAKAYGGHGSAARSGQEGLDPVSLAQAVRTILKRDQKG